MPCFKKPTPVDTQIEIYIDEPQLEKRFQFLQRIFKLTFLIFRDYKQDSNKIRIPQLLFCIAMVVLSGYQIGYLLWNRLEQSDESIVSSLIVFIWAIQCYASMLFIIRWQIGHHFRDIFAVETWSNLGEKRPKVFARKCHLLSIYLFFYSMSVFIAVMQTTMIFFYYFPGLTPFRVLDPAMFGCFGYYFGGVAIAITTHENYTWLLVFTFYMLVLSRLRELLEEFTDDVKKIGSKSKDPKDLTEELEKFYNRLVYLTDLIRKCNDIFEVYAFLIIATNLPLIIFSLVMFVHNALISFKYGSYYLFNVFTCGVELNAITMFPARIYSALHSIEPAMYANRNIWLPHNEKVYQIAKNLIDHSNQQGLGITLWDFAIITKGMILTAASLILTYVILMEQQMNGVEKKLNGTQF